MGELGIGSGELGNSLPCSPNDILLRERLARTLLQQGHGAEAESEFGTCCSGSAASAA